MDRHALKQLVIFLGMMMAFYLATHLPTVIARPGAYAGFSMLDTAAALFTAELDRGRAAIFGILIWAGIPAALIWAPILEWPAWQRLVIAGTAGFCLSAAILTYTHGVSIWT